MNKPWYTTEINNLIRDLTSVGFPSAKSEVRRRLESLLYKVVQTERRKTLEDLQTRLNSKLTWAEGEEYRLGIFECLATITNLLMEKK